MKEFAFSRDMVKVIHGGRKECGTCHEGDETSEVRIGYETIGAREVLAGTNETTLFEGCRDCAERFAMTLRLVLPR